MRKILLVVLILGLYGGYSNAQNPNWIFAKSAFGQNNDEFTSIVLDVQGNIYTAGYFASPLLTLDSIIITHNNGDSLDIILAKYDSAGNVIWAKSAGGTGIDQATSIVIDVAGNIYLTGYYSSQSIFFGTNTIQNAGQTDIFLTKYDSAGNVIWAKSAGGTGFDQATSLSIDENCNTYVVGAFKSNNISFDSLTLLNNGQTDIFLAKYDSVGNVIWAKSAGGTTLDQANFVKVDFLGNIYVTGAFSSNSITFGSSILLNTNSGYFDIFLVKYDSVGNVIWAKSDGGTSNDGANSIAIDNTGDIYVTGWFYSSILALGSTNLINMGNYDFYLVKYNSVGNVIWAKSAGGNNDDVSTSLTMDSFGNIYLVGSFTSPIINFGNTTLINSGESDLFLVKLGSTVTGYDEYHTLKSKIVYPNPAKNSFEVELERHATIEILNINGELMKIVPTDENKINIDIRGLAKGLYLIKIIEGQVTTFTKLVKL